MDIHENTDSIHEMNNDNKTKLEIKNDRTKLEIKNDRTKFDKPFFEDIQQLTNINDNKTKLKNDDLTEFEKEYEPFCEGIQILTNINKSYLLMNDNYVDYKIFHRNCIQAYDTIGFIEKENSITPIINLDPSLEIIVLNWYKHINVPVSIQSTDKKLTFKENQSILKNRSSVDININLPKNFNRSIYCASNNTKLSTHYVDVLAPKFGDMCSYIEEDLTINTCQLIYEPNNNVNVTILLYIDTLQTFVITNLNTNMTYILEHRTEFGFIEVCTFTIHEKFVDIIKKQFDNMSFFTVDEINEEISQINFNINTTKNIVSEKDAVMNTLTSLFTKTNNISDRFKASAISDIIMKENPSLKIDNSFKTRLSTYLNEWNLNKKRYNDGIYYYGLILKQK